METYGCGLQRARLCVPRCYRERTGKSYQRFTEKVVFSLVFFLLAFLSCFSTRLGSHLARFLSGFGPCFVSRWQRRLRGLGRVEKS